MNQKKISLHMLLKKRLDLEHQADSITDKKITYQCSKKILKQKENRGLIKELQKRLESFTLKNLLAKSKMIGKKPKMNKIMISHLSPKRASNKLINKINKATMSKVFQKFDSVKEELYKEANLVKSQTFMTRQLIDAHNKNSNEK